MVESGDEVDEQGDDADANANNKENPGANDEENPDAGERASEGDIE